jgi:uncharacterized membrane protein YvlD (DUF360 family)
MAELLRRMQSFNFRFFLAEELSLVSISAKLVLVLHSLPLQLLLLGYAVLVSKSVLLLHLRMLIQLLLVPPLGKLVVK